jgi:hypothetical protein
MSQDTFSTLMAEYGDRAAAETARELRERQREILWQNIRRKGILAGLLLNAVFAFVFREDIGQLMPLPGHVKKSTHEERMKENLKVIKAEAKERQDALEDIFK